jgi:hypothetical protein
MSNWVAAILTTGVSIGLSALSYYVLEPVIAGKPVHIFQCNVNWKKLWLPTMVAIVLLGVNGESVVKAAPQSQHWSKICGSAEFVKTLI